MGKTLHSKSTGRFISGRTIQSTAANSSLPVSKGGKAMSPRLKKFMDRVVKSNAMASRASADSQHLNLTSRITGFDSGTVEEMETETEEFYNPFHGKDGRFTFKKGGKRGKIHVPMSDAARSSNAILRAHSAAKKSKEYKTAQKNARGSWANREKGQGGLRGIAKGVNSKKADAARAMNAKAGATTKKWNNDPQLAAIKKKFGGSTFGNEIAADSARAGNAQGGKATAGVTRTKSDVNAASAAAAAKVQAMRANAGGK